MEKTSIAIILLSCLSVVSTIIGVGLAFFFKKSVKGIVIGIGFSVGIMLLISFFELIPESLEASGLVKTFLGLFLGVFFIGILNLIIPHTHLVKENEGRKRTLIKTAYLIVIGLILHDFPEGFAMATSYIHSSSLGILVALAIAIHNIPEEFAMAVPLLLAKKKELVLKAAFLSALAEPAGAVLGLATLEFFPSLNSFFMAFAAGAMIFVSLHELFPMAHKYGKIPLFILGLFLSVLVHVGLTMLV